MSKPGLGCGYLLSARPIWSPTPRLNYSLMQVMHLATRMRVFHLLFSNYLCAYLLFLPVTPHVSCPVHCTGFLGDSNYPNTTGRRDHKCQSVSAVRTQKVPGRRSGSARLGFCGMLNVAHSAEETCKCLNVQQSYMTNTNGVP